LIKEVNKAIRNKIKIKELRNKSKQRTQQTKQSQSQGQAYSPEPPPEFYEGSSIDYLPEIKTEVKQNIPTKAGDEFQERDIARLLVTYGGEMFDEENNVTVAQYVLANIQDVIDEFDSTNYKLIVNECIDLISDGKKITPQYFISHKDPNMCEIAIDLIQSPHEYSPGWEERDMYLNTQKMPDLNFVKDSIEALRVFKLKKVIRVIENNQEKLKEVQSSGDMEAMMKLLKVHSKLLKIREQLSGERTVTWRNGKFT